MSLLRRFLLIALALLLATAPVTAQSEESIEIQGEIREDDSVDPVRKVPGKMHEIKLAKGKLYSIILVSNDFDSYLRLVDAAGKTIAEDDDSYGNANARIKYTPANDEVVKVYACTFAGGGGAYTLFILGPGAVPTKAVAKKNTVPTKAEVLLDITGQIQIGDARDPVRNHPGKVHEVNLKKNVTYQIDMTSNDLDSFLRLVDPAGTEVVRDEDSGGVPHARIRYVPKTDGAFKIFATTFNGGVGTYKLVCKTDGPIPPKAGGLALGAPAAGKPAATTNQLQPGDRPDPRRNHPSKVFTVELTKGKTYVIDMTAGFDTYLRLESPTGQNLAEDDDGGEGLNSRLRFECTEDGTYRIVATSFSGGTGQFNLSVAEQ